MKYFFTVFFVSRVYAANDEGVFKTEITPYTLKVKGQEVSFEVDEHPK